MLNSHLNPLPVLNYLQGEDHVNLTRDVWLTGLWIRVSATLSVAGGTTDGTLLDGHVARIIRRLRVVWDGEELVDMTGRFLRALTRRAADQGLQETAASAAGTQSGTDIEGHYFVPFARPWLMDPFETVLPPVNVSAELRAYVDFETATSGGSSSDAGTGAIIAGGDRDVTWDTEPDVEIMEAYAEKGTAPAFLPYISELTSFEQFQNASDPHVGQLTGRKRFESMILQTVYGSNQQVQDAIENVTFRAGSRRYIDRASLAQLRAKERYQFSGVDSDDTGYLFLPFADGGKLGNVINPETLSNPRLELDLAAPTSTPGRVKALMMELRAVPGLTQHPGSGNAG